MAKDPYGHNIELSDESFKEIKSLAEKGELSIDKWFGSKAHEEWLSQPWSEKDINLLKTIIKKTAESYKDNKPFYVPESSWNEKYMNTYSKILQQVSKKKNAPSIQDIHESLRKSYSA